MRGWIRKVGGVCAFLGGVFFHKLWDWAWELFRAKVGEGLFHQVEHALQAVPLGSYAEYVFQAALLVGAVWLWWPTARARFFPERLSIALDLHDGLARDERSHQVFVAQAKNSGEQRVRDCQLYLGVGAQDHVLCRPFNLRPGERRDIGTIRIQRSGSPFIDFRYADGEKNESGGLILPSGVYSLKLLSADNRPVVVPVELIAPDAVQQEWRLEVVKNNGLKFKGRRDSK